MSTKTTSDPVARARELLAGLPEQRLNTGSTGIYVTKRPGADMLASDLRDLLLGSEDSIPREIYVDAGSDDGEGDKNIALVFGKHHVYYASLFAQAPEIIRALLKKLDDSCNGEHACPGCGTKGCDHCCNRCR